jgi:hypothetical protein
MNPHLRPLDSAAPLPDGWTTEAAGHWNGHEVEIGLSAMKRGGALADR